MKGISPQIADVVKLKAVTNELYPLSSVNGKGVAMPNASSHSKDGEIRKCWTTCRNDAKGKSKE